MVRKIFRLTSIAFLLYIATCAGVGFLFFWLRGNVCAETQQIMHAIWTILGVIAFVAAAFQALGFLIFKLFTSFVKSEDDFFNDW